MECVLYLVGAWGIIALCSLVRGYVRAPEIEWKED